MKLITYTNFGHTEMCRNMVRSFRKVNSYTPITIFCMDIESKDALESEGHECIVIDYKKCNSEAMDWGTLDYRDLIQNKFFIIKEQMEKYGDVIFCDSDLFYFQDPVPYIEGELEVADVVCQTDPPHTAICTGFLGLRPSEASYRVIDMVNDYNPDTDGIFDDQLRFIRYCVETRIPVVTLPQELFPNGNTFFNEGNECPNKYLIHANYMIGYETKVNALKNAGAWIV